MKLVQWKFLHILHDGNDGNVFLKYVPVTNEGELSIETEQYPINEWFNLLVQLDECPVHYAKVGTGGKAVLVWS